MKSTEKNNLISDFYEKIKIITPNDSYHYFFGYYDMRATGNGINHRHLAHRVKFMDRLPDENDVCELGYLEDGRFYKIAETTAWNFQQGAMLQYHPNKENTVFYNVCENGRFMTVTHNLENDEKLYTDMATASISPNGLLGLSLNFGRIFAFRAGYGYAGFKDKNENIKAPTDDGVFLTDMQSGKSKLLVSYQDMRAEAGFGEDEKILVNHITFAPSSERYVMLVRNFYNGIDRRWKTSLVIGDVHGNIKTVIKKSIVSHYFWLSDKELLLYATPGNNPQKVYILNVDTGAAKALESEYFDKNENSDIHCTITPDRKYVIGDGYPIDGYRHILAINLETGESKSILKAKTVIPECPDIRCDLHARYVFNEKFVSFDTTHNGRREIAIFPVSEIKA